MQLVHPPSSAGVTFSVFTSLLAHAREPSPEREKLARAERARESQSSPFSVIVLTIYFGQRAGGPCAICSVPMHSPQLPAHQPIKVERRHAMSCRCAHHATQCRVPRKQLSQPRITRHPRWPPVTANLIATSYSIVSVYITFTMRPCALHNNTGLNMKYQIINDNI